MTGPARRWLSVCLIAVLAGLLGTAPARSAALFEEDFMDNGGYLRQYVSMNLQDIPETLDNDRYNLNMVRTQFLLESDLDFTGWANLHSRLRAAREHRTDYLNALENPNGPDGTAGTSDDETTLFPSDAATQFPRNGAASTDFYESFLGQNDLEVRELYLDLNLTRSTQLRLGKQLESWGKGSFQRALDLVSGFNNTWAPFVTDEEERRKSLIMANLMMEVPSWGGSLQVFYQPGYDDKEDIGTTDPGFGGRYTANGLRGVNTHEGLNIASFTGDPTSRLFLTSPTNPDANGAEVDSEKFGLRFRGMAFSNSVEYSLAYLHTHQKSAISHNIFSPYKSRVLPPSSSTASDTCPAVAIGGNESDAIYDLADDGTNNNSAGCLESGRRRESINPIVDVYGGSFNYYSPLLDLVTRGEIAYVKDRVFDRASDNATLNTLGLETVFSDQITKDEYRLMLGFDRTAYFAQTFLGADRPGLMIVEVFDFVIDDFEDGDRIIDTSHTQGLKEHTLEGVMNLRWSYANGYYVAETTGIFDLSYGGNWTLIPSLGINPTTNWRIDLTGVFVFEDTHNRPEPEGTFGTSYGSNGDADRITTQVSYQF